MPLSDQEIKHLLEKAEAYRDKKDLQSLEEALKCYDQLIENASPHPHYFSRRADIKHRLAHMSTHHNMESAINDISRAIELDPDRGEYYWRRGGYLSEGLMYRYDTQKEIDALARSVLGEGSDRIKTLPERIIADYKASIERNPTNSQAWLQLLEIYIRLHEWDDAISVYGFCKPYIGDKGDKLVRSWLGCLALALAGDPIEEEDRRPLYDQSIHLGLDDMYSRITSFLIKIREQEGYKEKGEAAIEIHKRFIDHFEASNRGTLLAGLNCYDEAVEVFDEAINLSPKDVLAWQNKGLILQKLKHYEAALEAFEKVIDLQPDDAKVWFNKADVLKNLGRSEEALEALNTAGELSLEHNYYEDVLVSFFTRKEILTNLGRFEEALEVLNETKELFLEHNYFEGVDYACIVTIELLCELNRWHEAMEVLRKTVGLFDSLKESHSIHQIYSVALDLFIKHNRLEEMMETLSSATEYYCGEKSWEMMFRAYKKVLKPCIDDSYHETAKKVLNKVTEVLVNLDHKNLKNGYNRAEVLDDTKHDLYLVFESCDFFLKVLQLLIEHNHFKEAIEVFNEKAMVLYNLVPDCARHMYERASKLFIDHELNDEAFKTSDKIIELMPDDDELWYERARIYCLLRKDKANALVALSRAIELNADCKEWAKRNEVFKTLWDDEDFKRIVG